MDFTVTEDQQELRATVRAFLTHHHPMARTRQAAESDGFAAATWRRLISEMELTSLAVAAEFGGAGATFTEVGIALEELGRVLAPVPYLPTVVAAAALAPDAEAAAAWLPRVSAGAVATVALGDPAAVEVRGEGREVELTGTIEHVLEGHRAELIVLAAGPAAYLVAADPAAVSSEPHPTLDQTRRQATLRLRRASALALRTSAQRTRDVLGVALACEAVGAADHVLALTLEHLRTRVQFGRPLGSFQALKHRCADLAVLLESARSVARYAAWAVDGAPEALPTFGPLAQLVCGRALRRISGEAIQLHGGIGFTWEHDVHLYFKRASADELLFGPPAELRRTIGRRAGILAATG